MSSTRTAATSQPLKLAVDRKVEKGEIPLAVIDLEPSSDRRDAARAKRP
jgi:hypothetical protein